MNKIEFIIPSLNRPAQLQRCIKSIPKDCIISPFVEKEPRALTTIVNEAVAQSTGDIVSVIADHLVLQNGCVEELSYIFKDLFPDLDGGVGLNMENMRKIPNVTEYCFIALGRNVIDSFPEKAIFCPDYYHFYADTELGLYLNKTNRFIYGHDAKVVSYHPNAGNAVVDKTHRESRINRTQDVDTWKKRKELGLLWGETFELVNSKESTE